MADQKKTYAQSSDIKSRTFLQYRHDMKKKAIKELEFLPVLQELLNPAIVEKHGSDKHQWFLRKGGQITQAPDYRAKYKDGSEMLYEFQYAEDVDRLKFFDFKVSKVGLKKKGVRQAHTDRKFFYVVKPGAKFAFIEPKWIMEKGDIGNVAAWGNSPAFRVPENKFKSNLKDGDENMRNAIIKTDSKNLLLEEQTKFLSQDIIKFSSELQNATDEGKLIEIMPKTLDGFYRVCFLLGQMNKQPNQPNMWLVYLFSLFSQGIKPNEFAKWMFAFDFLYFHCDNLADNEIEKVKEALDNTLNELSSWEYKNGAFCRDSNISQVEETIAILHVVNLLEDIRQDFFVEYKYGQKVSKIFESLPDSSEVADFIRSTYNVS